MPKYDKAVLADIAKENHVIRDTLEKVYRLAEVLSFINSSDLLGSSLAIKGGTAINLLFFDLPRLSVDIDLDLAENLSKDEMTSRRARIGNSIERYMNAEGYTKSLKSKSPHSLDSFVYSYTNAGGAKDSLKIEINYSLRAHVLPLQRMRTKTKILDAPFEVLALAPIEVYASKTVALLTRAAVRDLYDMNQMIENWPFDDKELEQYRKTVAFYMAIATEKTPLEADLSAMMTITSKDVFTNLNQVIRDRDSFDLNMAKATVSEFLSKNLAFSAREILFLQSFRNGQYCPELLFDEKDILERIHAHPMAVWKTSRTKIQDNDLIR